MVAPIKARRDYYGELAKLTTMRNVVAADRAHPPAWRAEVRDHLEALIELLSRRPTESTSPAGDPATPPK